MTAAYRPSQASCPTSDACFVQAAAVIDYQNFARLRVLGALAVSRYRQSRLRQDTIEAGIVPKIIPHGIQFQISVVETKRLAHEFTQFVESAIAISRQNQHLRETHFTARTGNGINARRKYLGGVTRMPECLFLSTQSRLGDCQLSEGFRVARPLEKRR